MKSYDRLYIGGEWREPATTDTISVISPHTEEVVATVPAGSQQDMDSAVAAAREAFDHGDWPRLSVEERLAIWGRFIAEYDKRRSELAEVVTQEMGGPISQVKANSISQILVAQKSADFARELRWVDHRVGTAGQPIQVTREPVGVAVAVVPWNAPQFLTMVKIAPAMVTGCTAIVKPASETPVDALMLGEIADTAGLPKGVLSVVSADKDVSQYLVGHPGVDKVAFTGSTEAGRTIGEICGRNLTRVTLELGGKSAAIVLDDADTDAVVAGVAQSVLWNNGQVCTCNSRMVVVRSRYEEILDALKAHFESLVIGDPMDEKTQIGPVLSARQRDRVEHYIQLGLQQGARLVTGGPGRPDGFDRGWYVKPTLFADVDPDSRIAQEEIFGPVLSVSVAKDEDEAIAIANDSTYGLGGGVWTADDERARRVAARVRTGNYGINYPFVLDPMSPFGGEKGSGLGSELGPEGLDEYLRYKTVVGSAAA